MKKIIRKKTLILLFVLLLVVVIGGTFSFFKSDFNIADSFKTLTFDVNLTEEFYDDWGTKKVTITNNEETNTPIILRINYNELWLNKDDDNLYLLSNKINGQDVVTKNWTGTFLNDFVYDDGWYYYKKLLNAQDSIQILESINLNNDIISSSPYFEDYTNYKYQLVFNYEVIQADQKAVKDIWGKDITISGNNITW